MPNPITSISLYSCKLDRSGHKTVDFASASARDSYFSSSNSIATLYTTITNATYARENKTITVGINADVLDANGVNYCRYVNPQFSNFYFYAFIDNIEYVASETSRLYIRTDVFVTNMGAISFDECFVEREHVADDQNFTHLLAEPSPTLNHYARTLIDLNLFAESLQSYQTYWRPCVFATGSTITPTTQTDTLGGIVSQGYLYTPINSTKQSFDDLIDKLVTQNAEILYTCYIPINIYNIATSTNYNLCNILATSDADTRIITDLCDSTIDTAITIPISIDFSTMGGDAVRNNKINNYPYRFFKMADMYGQEITLKPEDMYSFDFKFKLSIGAAPIFSAWIDDYQNTGNTRAYSINITDFPPVPYAINYYQQYLSLHKNSVEVDLKTANFNLITGIASNVISAVAEPTKALTALTGSLSSVLNYESKMAGYEDMKRLPPATHNLPDNTAKVAMRRMGFKLYEYILKPESRRITEEFFDAYGYNVSTIKTPQISSRPHYNYVKTNGININGQIAKNDKQELAKLFDEGLTVWHMSNGATYGVYDDANAPT